MIFLPIANPSATITAMLKPFIYTVLVLAGAGLAGCTFDGSNTAQGFDQVDVAPDGGNGMQPQNDSGIPTDECPVGSDIICATGQPDSNWEVQQDILINTDSDSRCRTLVQPNNTKVCLFYVDGFTLADGVRLRAIGSRPLLIASDHDIVIDGIVDVSSARGQVPGASANSSVCSQGDSAKSYFGAGGGGAGGSFQGLGGNGGTGYKDGLFGEADGGVTGSSLAPPATLRGGCAGQRGGDSGGQSGASGGAVGFVATNIFTLSQDALIIANGSGGQGASSSSGGGGAGSGGFVSIAAPELFLLGEISANGGGGGGGGALFEDGSDGRNGSDAQAADGGVNSGSGGNGGKGSSSQALISGENGNSASAGGGGGGGGAGYIMLTGQVTSAISTSPAPTYL